MIDSYAVIGNPIHHSLSPLIHSLFAEQTNQQLTYRRILVELDGLAQALDEFAAEGGRGLNITLPFKHSAFFMVNAHSERAVCAEAINTIRFDVDGSRYGDNTDGVGLIRDIARQQFSLQSKRILIVGAGGAVRGVLKPLLDESPQELVIANRTEDKAIALADLFSQYGPIQACAFPDLEKLSFDLIVNCTSASLRLEELALPQALLRKDTFCYDMAYGQSITPFLQWAKNAGAAKISNGLGMLVEQAAESFYLWRGVRPDVEPVLVKLKGESDAKFAI